MSALKFCEYAALALAVPLRSGAGCRRLVLPALVGWSAVATAVGILQFLGGWTSSRARRPAQREPSLLGIHDLAALSGGALTLGSCCWSSTRDLLGRALAVLAIASGGLGLVISGALTGVIGHVVRARRRRARRAAARAGSRAGRARSLATVAAIVTLGTVGMRGTALRDFAAFIGIHRNETPGAVESYSQRTVLGYIGLKIFLTEPVTGVGFQGSNDEWAYGPQLAAAHRRFPDQPPDAFPSPAHPWGVQNLYLETLADFGLIGAAALAGTVRRSNRGRPPRRCVLAAPARRPGVAARGHRSVDRDRRRAGHPARSAHLARSGTRDGACLNEPLLP